MPLNDILRRSYRCKIDVAVPALEQIIMPGEARYLRSPELQRDFSQNRLEQPLKVLTLKTSDLLKMIAAGVLQNLGYRQLNLWWRATGCVDYLRGKTAWGRMERRGFNKR